MNDGPWISVDDEWLNLGEAQQVELVADDESDAHTLTITWSIDQTKSYTVDADQRDEIADTLDDLLDPDTLDVEETDLDVSIL